MKGKLTTVGNRRRSWVRRLLKGGIVFTLVSVLILGGLLFAVQPVRDFTELEVGTGSGWQQFLSNVISLPRLFHINTSGIARAAGVADYTCDGTADNVQYQASIDALPVAGGTVIVLSGTYNFAAAVNVNDTNIRLAGYGATLQPSVNLDYAFNITGTYATIEGFTIDGNVGGASFYFPIYAVAPATNVTIAHNNITEVQFQVAATVGVNIYIDNGVSYADIHHNYIADSGAQVYGIMVGHFSGGGAAVTEVNVSNNFVKDVTYNGIGIYNNTSQFIVDSNIVESAGWNCISVSPGNSGVVSNNVVYGATTGGESGIEIETNPAHGADNTYRVGVTGNQIDNCDIGLNLETSGGATTLRDISVKGNIISTTADSGMRLVGAAGTIERLTISGNTIQNANAHAVNADAGTHYVSFIGNTIEDATASGVLLNGSDYWIISGNTIDGANGGAATNHAIRLLGTSTHLTITGNLLINTGGDAANEGYALYTTAAADNFIVFKGNSCWTNFSLGAYIANDSTSFDLMPVSVEIDLSAAAEDFPVFTATVPSQIAGYTVNWTEAAGDANTCDIRVGEVTSGGVADDDEFDSYTTAGNEALGRSDIFHTTDMSDLAIAVGTYVTVGHTQKTGNGKVIITLWIVQQAG